MAEVGVRELKQRLSQYLERAEGGEVVTVTDRGRPKAILAPLPGAGRLEAGIADGWIEGAGDDPLGPSQRWHGSQPVLDALREDRGE